MAEQQTQDYPRSCDGPGENPVVDAGTQERHLVERQKYSPRYKYNHILFKLGVLEAAAGCISIVLAIATLIIATKYRRYKYEDHVVDYTVYHYTSVVTGPTIVICSFGYGSYDQESLVSYEYTWTHSSQGVWAGVLLLISGILGVKAKKKPSVSMYHCNMAVSIITANIMLLFIVFSVLAAVESGEYPDCPDDCFISLRTIHSVLSVLGFCSSIVCTIHSAYCCAGVCGRRRPFRYVVEPVGNRRLYRVVQLQNGRFVSVPCRSTATSSHQMDPLVSQLPQGRMTMRHADFQQLIDGHAVTLSHPAAAPHRVDLPAYTEVPPYADLPAYSECPSYADLPAYSEAPSQQ